MKETKCNDSTKIDHNAVDLRSEWCKNTYSDDTSISDFKTELKRLIERFNESNDCILQDVDLNCAIYGNQINENINSSYDITLKIK